MQRAISARSLLLLLVVASLLAATLALPGHRTPVADAAAQADANATAVTYGGEVAREDLTVQFRGQATGADEVVFVLVGSAGAVVAETGATDADGGFDRDVPLEGFDRPLNPGEVRAFVFTPGADGVYGTEGETPETNSDLVDFAMELGAERLSQPQVVQRLQRATVDVMGSDDLVSSTEFVLAAANTQITELSMEGPGTGDVRQFSPGDTIVVSGVTNRRPDQNAIDVSVTQGPSAGAFDAPIVNEWGTDGQWSVTIPVPPDARPGNYTVRASDGDSRDTVQIQVVAQQAQGAQQPGDGTDAGNTTGVDETDADGGADAENETDAGGGAANETVAVALQNETAGNETTAAMATATAETTATPTTTPAETTTTTATEAAVPTATEEATPATTETGEQTTTETGEQTTTTPGQPGFGALVAVLAGLLALVARSRLADR